MALRTQVDPYVLLGDSLADLPAPGAVAQGTLFHEEATGACRILVINPVTQVRTWEEFCGGATGATAATGPSGTVFLVSQVPGVPHAYPTIAAALAAAALEVPGATAVEIALQPGTYAESFALPAGYSLVGLAEDPARTIVTGALTVAGAGARSATGVTLGSVAVSGAGAQLALQRVRVLDGVTISAGGAVVGRDVTLESASGGAAVAMPSFGSLALAGTSVVSSAAGAGVVVLDLRSAAQLAGDTLVLGGVRMTAGNLGLFDTAAVESDGVPAVQLASGSTLAATTGATLARADAGGVLVASDGDPANLFLYTGFDAGATLLTDATLESTALPVARGYRKRTLAGAGPFLIPADGVELTVIDNGAAAADVTLPRARNLPDGTRQTFRRATGATGALTLSPPVGTIDGGAALAIGAAPGEAAVTLQTDWAADDWSVVTQVG